MEPFKTLKEIVIEATERAVKKSGGPATLGAILGEAAPPEGYVEDYRRAAVKNTKTVAWTSYGDPLRVARAE